MTHRFASFRRFRFNRPQRIAAGLLLLFLLQGLFVTTRQTLTDRDYQYARCGRETWEAPSPLSGYFTSCGNIRDGILAYRAAGLPLTLNVLVQRGLDQFRSPEDRYLQTGGRVSLWELRHQMTHVLLLLRLPFLFAGCLLGAGLWWVTRRLYGNLGGYTALALYCFSPSILQACLSPSAEILAALGVYGAVYTAIGVAHAMQGPRRKWRPRIVLLTAALAIAAGSHIVALPVAALLGLVLMLWVAEGRRSETLPIILFASGGAIVVLFAFYNFSPDAFSYVFRSASGFLWLSVDPARRFFTSLSNAGLIIAASSAILLYFSVGRSRYFGNTAPLFCTVILFALVMTGAHGSPWLWALPFLFTFIAGVFADAYETPRGRLAFASILAIVVLQAALCVPTLLGLI
ncbi:MAG: hypothetical protein WBD67_07840 [Terracidiphilus sp.]